MFTVIDIAGYEIVTQEEVSEKKLATIYKIITELHRHGLLVGKIEIEKALQALLKVL